MSFQDLDFKSDRACLTRPGNSVPATSTNHLKLLLKLLLVATMCHAAGVQCIELAALGQSCGFYPQVNGSITRTR